MLGNPGTYANKKRKKPVLKQKKASDGSDVVKSNPSKRHRDRLNGELDRLTELLPFPDDVRSRLDKLSVLRLSVGYLRVKSYFKATIKNGNNSVTLPGVNGQNGSSGLMMPGLSGQNNNSVDVTGFSEGDLLLKALNGFVMVVTADGLVFYSSPTIKEYLGFQQSDVVHQSVFDLIHTDDRAMFRQQLHFALNPPKVPDEAGLQGYGGSVSYSPDQLPPENSSFLERSFVCRFRCLLDNSSGFLALKFQGRLKYLHGQSVLRDNVTRTQPQLALFSIAMPVQPSTIVEIRAKMLLFQTKHKLDFTPTGVDGRGKIILGYSEIELCMKGSGYQFIHAADMMYCADNHIRMMKTGESGLTVFRLLSKSGGWVWVKSNAKIIFKGGRPEFIIAYQKALTNAEGEENLRQRRLQLPFSFTTGEALLYNNSLTVDPTQFQFNSQFNGSSSSSSSTSSSPDDVFPRSLVDCFLKQGQAVYSQNSEAQLPVDQVFMDSRALVTVTNDSWQDNGVSPTAGEPVVVKEEAKQSVMAIIDGLEKMSQNGNFADMLQSVNVSEEELIEWENALKRINQEDGDLQGDVRAELDSVLTNEIFDFIDSVLFKEKGEADLNSSPPSCLAGISTIQDSYAQGSPLSVSVPQLFQSPSQGCAYSPVNGLYAPSQEAVTSSTSAPMFNGTQKLCHQTLLPDTNLPPLQQLQLQDIFSPSIELPELTVSDASVIDASLKYASRHTSNSHMGCPPGISGQPQSGQSLLSSQNNVQDPTMAANRQLLCGSVQQHNSLPPHMMDILPPLVPCNDVNCTTAPNITVPFAAKVHRHLEPQQQVQQWSQQQRLPHCGVAHNGHDPTPACHSLSPESQTFPHAGHLPRSVNGLNHIQQQGGLACGQAATHSSCMFDQAFSSSPAGGDGFTFSGSLSLSGSDSSLDQTAPQNPCYFQWGHSEPVVETLAINQENNVNPNPMTLAGSMPTSEHSLNVQPYLECQRQTQQEKAVAGEHNRSFFCS